LRRPFFTAPRTPKRPSDALYEIPRVSYPLSEPDASNNPQPPPYQWNYHQQLHELKQAAQKEAYYFHNRLASKGLVPGPSGNPFSDFQLCKSVDTQNRSRSPDDKYHATQYAAVYHKLRFSDNFVDTVATAFYQGYVTARRQLTADPLPCRDARSIYSAAERAAKARRSHFIDMGILDDPVLHASGYDHLVRQVPDTTTTPPPPSHSTDPYQFTL